jgi:hypothetical protein
MPFLAELAWNHLTSWATSDAARARDRWTANVSRNGYKRPNVFQVRFIAMPPVEHLDGISVRPGAAHSF